MHKNMNKKRYVLTIFVLVVLVGFAGCGKDTREAKLEDARIAMDNGDFNKVISLTEELLDTNGDGVFNPDQDLLLTTDDAEVAHLSVSARFGRAGINFTEMLTLAEQNGAAPKPSVLAKTNCQDVSFQAVSNMIPVTLGPQHLTDLDVGINLVDVIIQLYNDSEASVGHVDKLKQAHLIRAIGHAARIIVAIIVATDTNGDNRPDDAGGGNISGTTLEELAAQVMDSFVDTLSALVESGISDSDLRDSIIQLRTNITGSPSNITINGTNLFAYLQGLVAQC